MCAQVQSLTNINLMSKSQYDALSSVSESELYAVRCNVIIDTYTNGTSWYRVWSDGWIEQGGLSPQRTSNSVQTINFLKPFSNTNYNIVISNVTTKQENESGAITNKATNSFNVYAWNTRSTSWYACGF